MTTAFETGQPARLRAHGARNDIEVIARMRKANGQLSGVASMVEDGRYCIEVLDQLAAVGAAIDAVALLLLSDHIHVCVREAIESGETDEKVDELVAAVRRYVRAK